MKDISAAVAHLHSHGVTHKDIKAENVLLHNSPYEFCVKLCDFGLAKQESMGTGKTVAPTMMKESMAGAGTLAFMAPELQNPSLSVDKHSSAASDVFAICVTFIQILLRRCPENSVFGFQAQVSFLYLLLLIITMMMISLLTPLLLHGLFVRVYSSTFQLLLLFFNIP